VTGLGACAKRYQPVAALAGLAIPRLVLHDGFEVRERLIGSAVTDFGALASVSADDLRPLTKLEVDRLQGLLSACWATFDDAYERVPASARAQKPEAGRSPSAIRHHLLDTDLMHRSAFGPAYRKPSPDEVDRLEPVVRATILTNLASTPLDVEATPVRRYGFDWTPRFAVRRVAWHALDHAWQLEDSMNKAP